MTTDEDEFLTFEDEDSPDSPPTLPPWVVLVVDDVQGVHDVTRMVLAHEVIKGRGLVLIDAYSGIEAREIIDTHPEIDLVLLDAIMETDHAGLDFARYVKHVLGRNIPIIVLRTGEPLIDTTHKRDLFLDDVIMKTNCTRESLLVLLTKWLPT